eukprot:GHVO01061549.1.p1 GENE.GHVO01061549.1~~GHVO01061549.1.p1  ORF type:complete len:171 (+),score=0.83 GHVO01061549.1:197-709(+)
MKALLEKKFSVVVPIFPWLSREFGNRGKSTHGFSGFNVLALFPRRPKISEDNEVLLTVNGELSVYKEIGLQHGITVIAGCPVARNLWELASCNECAWVDIDNSYGYIERVESLAGKRLTDEEIFAAVSQSEVHSMDTLEKFVRDTREALPAGLGFFGTRYKPVYFLIVEH